MFYGFFDSILRCNEALPELSELPAAPVNGALLEVRIEPSKSSVTASRNLELHPWLDDTDRVVQGRLGDAILIQVRGLADFLVRPSAPAIQCHPCPGAHPASVRHFLLNQILPRLISVRDPLVIHAGAVATRLGAIALIGPAGAGDRKSVV